MKTEFMKPEFDKITDEMLALMEEHLSITKDQIMNMEEDEELKNRIFSWALDLECDGIEEEADEKTIKIGKIAEKILNYLFPREPDENFEKDLEDAE